MCTLCTLLSFLIKAWGHVKIVIFGPFWGSFWTPFWGCQKWPFLVILAKSGFRRFGLFWGILLVRVFISLFSATGDVIVKNIDFLHHFCKNIDFLIKICMTRKMTNFPCFCTVCVQIVHFMYMLEIGL